MQNIDTDQIIPAEYLTLVPSKVSTCVRPLFAFEQPQQLSAHACMWEEDLGAWSSASQPDEYEKLGSYAMIGLPEELYPER